MLAEISACNKRRLKRNLLGAGKKLYEVVKKTKPKSLKTDEQNNPQTVLVCVKSVRCMEEVFVEHEFLAWSAVEKWSDAWFASLQMKLTADTGCRAVRCCPLAANADDDAINRHTLAAATGVAMTTAVLWWHAYCTARLIEVQAPAPLQRSHNQCNWFGHSCCSLPPRQCVRLYHIAEGFRLVSVPTFGLSKHHTICRLYSVLSAVDGCNSKCL